MNNLNASAALAGRLLLAALFLVSGIGKIAAPAGTIAYIASSGMPLPAMAYIGAVIVEVGFSIALVLGFQTRFVAVVMALFSLATAFAFHAHFGDQNQVIHFMKNFAIAGGFLQVAVFGAGRFGLDAKRQEVRGGVGVV
jgi:putative oxidoreductase